MLKGIGLLISGILIGAISMSVFRPGPSVPMMVGEAGAIASSSSGGVSDMRPRSPIASSEELLVENQQLRSAIDELEVEVRRYQDYVASSQNLPIYHDQSVPTGSVSVAELMDGGFSRERARELRDRYSELHVKGVKASLELESYASSPDGVLRQEIGDAEFERFVIASDRVPAVQVGSFAETSPAAFAGLRTGDQIVSYDGHRVFDAREVASLSFQGTPHQLVILEIIRDGQPVQLVVSGGALEAELISNGFHVPASFVGVNSMEP